MEFTVEQLFENVARFKYLGMTATNQNCVHVEIKNKLNSVGERLSLLFTACCVLSSTVFND
jgi:hypothetical protein